MYKIFLVIISLFFNSCSIGERTVIAAGLSSKDYDNRLGFLQIKAPDVPYEKRSSISLYTSCDYNAGVITLRLSAPPEPVILLPNKVSISIVEGGDFQLIGPIVIPAQNGHKFYDFQLKEAYCGAPPGSLNSKYKYTNLVIKSFSIKVDGEIQEVPELRSNFQLIKSDFSKAAYASGNDFKIGTYTIGILKELQVYGNCRVAADGQELVTVSFEVPAKIQVSITERSEMKMANNSSVYSNNVQIKSRSYLDSDFKSYQVTFLTNDCISVNEAVITLSKIKLNGIEQSIKPFKLNYKKDTFTDLIIIGQ